MKRIILVQAKELRKGDMFQLFATGNRSNVQKPMLVTRIFRDGAVNASLAGKPARKIEGNITVELVHRPSKRKKKLLTNILSDMPEYLNDSHREHNIGVCATNGSLKDDLEDLRWSIDDYLLSIPPGFEFKNNDSAEEGEEDYND